MSNTGEFHIYSRCGNLSLLFPGQTAMRTIPGRAHFMLTLRGRAAIEIDGLRHKLRPGTLMLILPGHLVRMVSHTDSFIFDYMCFDFDFLADFPLLLNTDISDQATNYPCVTLGTDGLSMAKQYFTLIGKRSRESRNSRAVTKGLLFSFIMEISAFYDTRNEDSRHTSRQDELTDGFFRLLHIYYKKEHAAAFYASRLCVSDKHLMRIIRQRTGKTFHFWLSDFILREAKLLLKSTSLTVTEVADSLSFKNPSLFARFFRKHTGASPSEYREDKDQTENQRG